MEGSNAVTIGDKVTQSDSQPVVEIYGTLPHCTRVYFRSIRRLIAATLLDMTALSSLERGFNECTDLEVVKITGMTNLQSLYFTFNQDRSLRCVDFDGYDLQTVTSASSAFNTCQSLQTVNADFNFSGITDGLGGAAFQDMRPIDKFPHTISKMPSSCTSFLRATQISKVIRPDWATATVTNFSYFFYECKRLTEVDLSNLDMSAVTNTNNSFQGCPILAKVTLPSSLSVIGANMFNGCYSLNEIHIQAPSATMAGTNAMTGVPSSVKIYVPYSVDHSILNYYQTATNWSTYASKIVEEPET